MRRSRNTRIVESLGARSIVLLGMMGCGKSAIGKLLASKLRLPFRDADHEIEEAAGRSIADIFAEYGEPEFRRLETRVIERLLDEGGMVLSLGGGAFMAEETRKLVGDKAVSIWLDVDIDTLVERVSRHPEKRPLVAQGNARETLTGLLEKRSPIYAYADLRVHSGGIRKSEMRDLVLRRLDEYLLQDSKKVKA